MAAVDRDPQKVAAVLRDYEETLEVLTINSKPLINDLTMAADRYKPLGAEIIGKIESRLFEVSTAFTSVFVLDLCVLLCAIRFGSCTVLTGTRAAAMNEDTKQSKRVCVSCSQLAYLCMRNTQQHF